MANDDQILTALNEINRKLGENTAVCVSIQRGLDEHVSKDDQVHTQMFTRVRDLELDQAKQRGAIKAWGAVGTTLASGIAALGSWFFSHRP